MYDDEGNRRFDLVAEQKSITTPCFMMMMGSFNNFVMVYNDVRLVWAARTVMSPVFIDTGSFGGT